MGNLLTYRYIIWLVPLSKIHDKGCRGAFLSFRKRENLAIQKALSAFLEAPSLYYFKIKTILKDFDRTASIFPNTALNENLYLLKSTGSHAQFH